MKTKFILAATLGLVLSLSSFAQDDSTDLYQPAHPKKGKQFPSKKEEKTVTIINENGKITVNGKPVEDIMGKIDSLKIDSLQIFNGEPYSFDFSGPITINRDFVFPSNKAFLGVITQEDEKGAKITSVTKTSPADKAGLKEGDIITKIDAVAISNADDLHNAIGKYKPDDNVTVTYFRGNNTENTVTAKLAKNKEVQVFAWNGKNAQDYQNYWKNFDNQFKNFDQNFNYSFGSKPRLGLQVQDLEEGAGVKVTNVNDDSPAAKAGLKENDIITQINGTDINTVDDIRTKTKELKEGDTYEIKYKRDGKTQSAAIKIPKKLKTADL